MQQIRCFIGLVHVALELWHYALWMGILLGKLSTIETNSDLRLIQMKKLSPKQTVRNLALRTMISLPYKTI